MLILLGSWGSWRLEADTGGAVLRTVEPEVGGSKTPSCTISPSLPHIADPEPIGPVLRPTDGELVDQRDTLVRTPMKSSRGVLRVAFDRQRGAPPSPIGSSRHV